MVLKNNPINNLFDGWSLAAFLMLSGGIALRLYRINAPLSGVGDELASVSIWGQMPFWDIPFNYQNTNNTILNTLVVAATLKTFGLNHFLLRLPVLLLGIFSLILCYSTAFKMTGDRRIALGALLLLAINGTHVIHSTTVRGYAYAIPLAQLALYMLLAMFQYSPKGLFLPPERPLPARGLLCLALACALGVWAIPTFVLFIGSILLFSGLSLLLKYRNKILDFRFPHTQTVMALSGSLAFFFLQYYILIPTKMRQEAFAVSRGLNTGEPLLSGILDHLISPCHSLAFVLLFLLALGTGLLVLAKRDGNLFMLFFCIVILTPGFIHAFNLLGVLSALSINPPPRGFIYIQPFFFICISIGAMAIVDNIHDIAFNRIGLNISSRIAAIILPALFFAPIIFCDLAELKNQIFVERANREPYPKVLEFMKKLGDQDLVLSSNNVHVWFYLYGADEMRKRVFNIMDKGKLGDIYVIEYGENKESDIIRSSIDGRDWLFFREYIYISASPDPKGIAMPSELFELAADYGLIKIHKIKPQYVTKRFGLDGEDDMNNWVGADNRSLNFQPVKTGAGNQPSIGFNEPFVLRSKEIELQGEGHFSMDINFMCIKNSRDYMPYFVNGTIRSNQISFTPSWLGNAWVMDHPYGEKIFNREWRPVIFLSKPEKSFEIIKVEKNSYRKNSPGFIRGLQGFRISYTLSSKK